MLNMRNGLLALLLLVVLIPIGCKDDSTDPID
jgi:hypothetical protein